MFPSPFICAHQIYKEMAALLTSDLNCNGYLYLALEIKELTCRQWCEWGGRHKVLRALPQNQMQIQSLKILDNHYTSWPAQNQPQTMQYFTSKQLCENDKEDQWQVQEHSSPCSVGVGYRNIDSSTCYD